MNDYNCTWIILSINPESKFLDAGFLYRKRERLYIYTYIYIYIYKRERERERERENLKKILPYIALKKSVYFIHNFLTVNFSLKQFNFFV